MQVYLADRSNSALSESDILILTYPLHTYVVHSLSPHAITVVTVQIILSQAENYQQWEQIKAQSEVAVFFTESFLSSQKLHKGFSRTASQ